MQGEATKIYHLVFLFHSLESLKNISGETLDKLCCDKRANLNLKERARYTCTSGDFRQGPMTLKTDLDPRE